jgi:hypothetical protein
MLISNSPQNHTRSHSWIWAFEQPERQQHATSEIADLAGVCEKPFEPWLGPSNEAGLLARMAAEKGCCRSLHHSSGEPTVLQQSGPLLAVENNDTLTHINVLPQTLSSSNALVRQPGFYANQHQSVPQVRGGLLAARGTVQLLEKILLKLPKVEKGSPSKDSQTGLLQLGQVDPCVGVETISDSHPAHAQLIPT